MEKHISKPWENEPDHVNFRSHNFPCILHRNHMGAWCGYVGVPSNHPWYRKGYDEVNAEVHGGLTYANECQGDICHVPDPGESDEVWWLGFDCAHAMDICPAHTSWWPLIENRATYKTMEYAKQETESLAEQAYRAYKEN